MEGEQEERMLSRQETAQRLSVSTRTVDRLILDGHIPVRRIGRRVLIRDADLAEFIRQREDIPPPQSSNQ